MPQFRVLIESFEAMLFAACMPLSDRIPWHAPLALRPAPPPRPNGQHVMYVNEIHARQGLRMRKRMRGPLVVNFAPSVEHAGDSPVYEPDRGSEKV